MREVYAFCRLPEVALVLIGLTPNGVPLRFTNNENAWSRQVQGTQRKNSLGRPQGTRVFHPRLRIGH